MNAINASKFMTFCNFSTVATVKGLAALGCIYSTSVAFAALGGDSLDNTIFSALTNPDVGTRLIKDPVFQSIYSEETRSSLTATQQKVLAVGTFALIGLASGFSAVNLGRFVLFAKVNMS